MKKVQQVMEKHVKRYQAEQQKKAPAKMHTTTPSKKAPPKPKEDVIEMGTDGGFDISSSPPVETNPPAPSAKPQQPDAKAPQEQASPSSEAKPPSDDNGENKQAPPPVGNGGTVPGKYVWTQTLSEVTVNVPVPDNTRGRDLNVVIAKKKLKVGLRGAGEAIIDEAPLCKPVIVDDSFWTVEDGNRLVINLQKSNQMEWWDCVVQGDPKIDVTTIQPENSSLADLDGETRKTVE
eukprot:CAMPEP_0176007014 /NCGR_PEP_ID=MMETSP0120_2-20121206/3015_1 /TAXON_ID=160619 /ORGANISM="Kryptoperidinium foliaceum, Strain CCMP 1326" /LENGTH=233 /DNA_ID=CAMNT_0017339763 /DNA_START=189 /DNA_END=887 /DNA_ORIENTATION=+